MGQASNRLKDYHKLINTLDPLAVVPTLTTGIDDLKRIAIDDKARATVLNYFAFHNTSTGNHVEAARQFLESHEIDGNTRPLINAIIAGRKSKDKALGAKLFSLGGTHANQLKQDVLEAELYDVLCHYAGESGDLDKAKFFGAKSLQAKDEQNQTGLALVDRQRPQFDYLQRNKNIISFSLFGDKPRYTRIAVENAKAAPFVYPGWTCRFYIDNTVPAPIIQQLSALNAQVLQVSPNHSAKGNTGLFWRFLVASDPIVDFFMVRDADSLISVREKVAVDEWISSDKDFHLLRDFYTHSELILAGLWGGVANRIPSIGKAISDFQSAQTDGLAGVHNHDQLFLRQKIWPAIKDHVMQHDSVFGWNDARDFPTVGKIEPVRHVGQDMGIFLNT